MEIFHCAGHADLEIPMYDGPCDGIDRPEKTQVIQKSGSPRKIKYVVNYFSKKCFSPVSLYQENLWNE